MMENLTREKTDFILKIAERVLSEDWPTIREVAGLIGLMVAYAEYSGVHFKTLEKDQIKALKRSKGKFEEGMWISEEGKKDMLWICHKK